MTMHDRNVLFAISMGLVLVVGLMLRLYRQCENRRLRKSLSHETIDVLLCDGYVFDLAKLMRVYCLSLNTRESWCDDKFCMAMLSGGKGWIRLTLRNEAGKFVLDQIESCVIKDWSFGDWYDDYRRSMDEEKPKYVVVGDSDARKAMRRHHLPAFTMSKRAVEQLVDDCIFVHTSN